MRKRKLYGRAVEASDGAAVELGKQIFGRIRDEINQLAIERFFFAERFRVGDRRGRKLGVSVPPGDVAAQVRSGFVQNFPVERVVDLNRLPEHFHDRRSRAGIRAGRHGGHVRREQDEKSGRGGA